MDLLSIGGQILGGLFGSRSAKKQAEAQRQAALNQWVVHREASERGGFNPLATLGLSQPVAVASSNNYMGEAVANSALILADNYAKTRQAAIGQELEKVRAQRDQLARKVTANTIRPKVPGVYDHGFGIAANPKPSAGVPIALSGVPDQIAERNREKANTVGDYSAASLLARSPFMSAQTASDHFGEPGELGFGTTNWLHAMTVGGPENLRAEWDAKGVTTPGRNYFTWVPQEAWKVFKKAATGKLSGPPAPKKDPNAFSSYYGAMFP